IARGPRPIVELHARHDEDATSREEVRLGPLEPPLEQRTNARLTARLLEGWRDDHRDEARDRLFEDGNLQVLLRREVREEPALRHPDVLGELADGQALEPKRARERDRGAKHRAPRLVAFAHASIIERPFYLSTRPSATLP